MSQSVITQKNYTNCGFKLKIPTVTIHENKITLDFDILFEKDNKINLAILDCIISDSRSNRYVREYDSYCFLNNSMRESAIVKVPISDDMDLALFYIEIGIITEEFKKVSVIYKYTQANKIEFKNVIIYNSEEHIIKFNEIKDICLSKIDKRQKREKRLKQKQLKNERKLADEKACIARQLKEYKDSIDKEIYFLKNNGGRKYKVVNGELLEAKNGKYSYVFELETELHIAEDSPITVSFKDKKVEGKILLCNGFKIIVVLDTGLGKIVHSAYVSVEPWKLLEALNNRLDDINSNDKIALSMFSDGPKLIKNETIENIVKGQENAKKSALNTPITVIWGPPGTGKTHTMSEIAIDFLEKGKRILIVSQSNISVDGVTNKIYDMMLQRGMDDFFEKGSVLRYGYVRDEELSKNENVVSFNYTLNQHLDLKTELQSLLKEKSQVKTYDNRIEFEKQMKNIKNKIKDYEKENVLNAQIVATTISQICINSLFDNLKYDVVMFDEVSMAYIPQVICAASFAEEHFICVGDFRQLAPISQAQNNELLKKDIFNFLGISQGVNKLYNHSWLVMLNEQRRMHPDISAFSNKNIYRSLLENHKSVYKSRNAITHCHPFIDNAITLIDLAGTYSVADKNNDNSRYNILSAIISFGTAVEATKSKKSVGIITPYAAQARLIKAMIRDSGIDLINCSTVHQFQGSEKDVIIFDVVESFPAKKPGFLMTKNDNGSLTRLINVAITRARGKFIVIANSNFWTKNTYISESNSCRMLINYLLEKGNVVKVDNAINPQLSTLKQYITRLTLTKNIKIEALMRNVDERFQKDISSAKHRIIVSIPDGNFVLNYDQQILKFIKQARDRGVEILAKSNDYESLPSGWQEICDATENATFPIISIDDKIVWYGLPQSNKVFKHESANNNYWATKTICQNTIRLSGENTVNMIMSLSDLENKSILGLTAHIAEQNEGINILNKDMTLSLYVNKHEKCEQCGKLLTLQKSQRGNLYLKCLSCKNVSYLTPDIVNCYIDAYNVKCPKHNCDLEAKLGKRGVYIRCTKNHFLNPNEI